MEALSKACPCIGWAGEPPASSASATVLVGSGRWLLGYVWEHSCPPSYSLAHFQSWMAHPEMTLCLGWQSPLEKLFSRLAPGVRGEEQESGQSQDALVFWCWEAVPSCGLCMALAWCPAMLSPRSQNSSLPEVVWFLLDLPTRYLPPWLCLCL